MWWQWDWVGRTEPVFRELGLLDDSGLPLREQIDARIPLPELYTGASPNHPKVLAARERYPNVGGRSAGALRPTFSGDSALESGP